jgi:hypothetical protein
MPIDERVNVTVIASSTCAADRTMAASASRSSAPRPASAPATRPTPGRNDRVGRVNHVQRAAYHGTDEVIARQVIRGGGITPGHACDRDRRGARRLGPPPECVALGPGQDQGHASSDMSGCDH